MKTVFTSHGHDSVSIKYLDQLTDLVTNRTFIRRKNYVFEIIDFKGTERQICKGLNMSGITLMCDSSIDLIDIIRKEYRKLRAQIYDWSGSIKEE